MTARFTRVAAVALALGAAISVSPDRASGQVQNRQNYRPGLYVVNPNPFIAPGVRLQQYAYNMAVLGKAYSQIPPYALGYNPYPLAVNYGPMYNPGGFRPSWYAPSAPLYYGNVVPSGVPYAGGYAPMGPTGGGGYMPSPYAYSNSYPSAGGGGYTAAGAGLDPLTGLGYNAGGASNPYYWNPYSGGYAYGESTTLQAYGQLGLDQEKARILREQSNQMKLDTRKKTIDTLAYIRANEYTFTQEQSDLAKRLLKRIQSSPTQGEIHSGKSLNVLLEDLGKWELLTKNDKLRLPTVSLDENDVLKKVNIASPGSNGNIGLLRDNGRFAWPAAFEEKDVATEKERKDIELQTQELYQQAANAKLDKNTLKDLESSLQNLKTKLSAASKTQALSPQGYLEGQRFLESFDSAITALRKGDLLTNLEFQQKFAKGGKTVEELIKYMTERGLRFAPAAPGEEPAYHALQTALAARSIAIHSEVTATGRDN